MHATIKNLELLAEGRTVTGAISQATERKIVTVQPWVEVRDGKRFLHIPEGAGYRNLFREMPPQQGFRRPDGSSVCPVRASALTTSERTFMS